MRDPVNVPGLFHGANDRPHTAPEIGSLFLDGVDDQVGVVCVLSTSPISSRTDGFIETSWVLNRLPKGPFRTPEPSGFTPGFIPAAALEAKLFQAAMESS